MFKLLVLLFIIIKIDIHDNELPSGKSLCMLHTIIIDSIFKTVKAIILKIVFRRV